MLRPLRFLRSYLGAGPDGPVEEVRVPVGDGEVPATLHLPRARGPAPGWVLLHGITVAGREHRSLTRFARALAASGGVVLVPEVPSWRALRIDPAAARETIAGAALYLAARPEVERGGVGVVGFSFGATQALVSAADPRVRDAVRAVVGFGGYADLERTVVCQMTGEHEWRGKRHLLAPDPYGRWVAGANHLALARGMEGMGRVQERLRAIAAEAGRRGTPAFEREYDPLKEELRAELEPGERGVWDLFAPAAGLPPHDLAAARELGREMARAAIEAEPLLDPRSSLADLRCRVVLAHGYEDRLIPFTETLRLREALPPRLSASATITRLFAHSGGARTGAARYVVEGIRFVLLLQRALGR